MDNINICYVLNNHIDYVNLTLKSISYVKKFFRSKEYQLKFFVVSEEPIDNLPDDVTNVISPYKDIPLLWQRMHIPELLDVDRVIFLDSDTICLTCISKLWKIDLQDNIVGMCNHYCMNSIQAMLDYYSLSEYSIYNKHNDLKQYYNCGVVLIDCVKWRDNGIVSKCEEAYNQIKYTPHYKNDEPTYNVILADDIYNIDPRWNYYPRGGYTRAHIIHYYGMYFDGKPIHNEFTIFADVS